MVKFGVKDIIMEMDEWTRHYPKISVLVERKRFLDGICTSTIIPITTIPLIKDIEKCEQYSNHIFQQEYYLYPIPHYDKTYCVDTYIELENLEYQKHGVEVYGIEQENVKQTHYVRLGFKFDETTVYLESHFQDRSTNNNNVNFYQCLFNNGENIVERTIEQLIASNQPIEKCGVQRCDNVESMYVLQGADDFCVPKQIIVELQDIMNALVSVELVRHEWSIVSSS